MKTCYSCHLVNLGASKMYWNQQQHVCTDFVVGQCIHTMRVIGLSLNFTIYALVTSLFQDYFEYVNSKCRVRIEDDIIMIVD